MSSPDVPESAAALFFEGNRLQAEGLNEGAEQCFRQALAIQPEFAEVSANLALLLERDGRMAAAERQYRHALACNPRIGLVHLNFGAFLLQQRRLDEAENCLRIAIAQMPASPLAWSNLGMLLACRKREAEAENCYRTAMALDPDYRTARFNLSYLLLRQGRFTEGWPMLEARDWSAQIGSRFALPRWQGESLSGRSLLVCAEAGHGDTIQFCRYATQLKARGARRVGLVVQPGLKRLLHTLAAVDAVVGLDELDEVAALADWDGWVPALSLPCHCQNDAAPLPAELPYLRAEYGRVLHWGSLLSGWRRGAALCVGLVWKGNPRFENDAERSLPGLATLAPLGTVAGVRFVSLQKGAGEDEVRQAPAGMAVFDAAPFLDDFAETAAAISQLDLVISVDTAVAHLAGALGKRCWLLLPDYLTDWRWGVAGETSAWYPGVMRLFRQEQAGDWQPTVLRLRAALQGLIDCRSSVAALCRLQPGRSEFRLDDDAAETLGLTP